MTSLAQLLLVIVITTLTFLLGFVAVQVFRLLQDFRLTLQKVNQILDNTQTISESAARPITAVNEFFSEVQTLVSKTEDRIIESTPDRVISAPRPSSPKTSRRFFRRSGLPLRSS